MLAFILSGIAVVAIVTNNDGIAALACILIMGIEMFTGDKDE